MSSDQKQLEKLSDLKALYDTEGGKVLVESLAAQVVTDLSVMAAQHRTLTHAEFISYAARVDACMSVANRLLTAERFRDELQAALQAKDEETDTP